MTRTIAVALAVALAACVGMPPAPRWPDGWSVPSPRAADAAPSTLPHLQLFDIRGVSVTLVENHRVPLVTIAIVHAAAGSRDDGDRPGVAALTSDVIAAESAAALELDGASLEVDITTDATVTTLHAVHARVAGRDRLADAVAQLATEIVQPRFADDDVARARAKRVAEIADRNGRARTIAAQAFDRLAYGDHPYARPAEGDATVVAALARDDLRAFHASHYAPQTARIIVAGDLDRATLTALLDPIVSAWLAQGVAPLPAATPPPPAPPPPPAVVIDQPGARTAVVLLGARVAATGLDTDTDADLDARAAADVANAILGGSTTSRIDHRLRDELKLTSGAGSSFWRGALAATWSVAAAVPPERAGDAIRELRALVAAAGTTEATAGEVEAARTLLARAIEQDFATVDGAARSLARLAAQGHAPDALARYLAALGRVTPAAARDAFAAAAPDAGLTVVVGDAAHLQLP